MTLTENDARVYAHVRDMAKEGRRATIDGVSRSLGIARSSVARVAQHFGYRGWTDFVTQLVQYHQPDDRAGAVSDTVDVVAEALERGRSGLVLIDAVGDAEICVLYLILRLAELGFATAPYSRGMLDAPTAAQGGVLLVFNESGMTLLPSCLNAAAYGFEVVAITASHDTPVSKVADVNVVIKNRKSTAAAYEPNYFTAGALVLLERAMARCARRDGRRERVTDR